MTFPLLSPTKMRVREKVYYGLHLPSLPSYLIFSIWLPHVIREGVREGLLGLEAHGIISWNLHKEGCTMDNNGA